MVKKTFLKTIKNTLKENISRFLVICVVVMLGICFISGLGTLSSSLTDSINDYYKDSKGLDFIIKSKSQTGFAPDEIKEIKNLNKIDKIKNITSIDNKDTRLIISDLSDNSFHKITITKGRKIKKDHEILVDQIAEDLLGKKVKVLNEEFKIVGIVKNPSYYTSETEKSIDNKELKHIYYLDTNYYEGMAKYLTTDLYVKLDNSKNIFSKEYLDEIKKVKKELEKKSDNYVVLSLEENLSYALVKNYGEKISLIAAIFPLFFILVSCLVVYSTISRLIEEERPIIGCYRSLGISKGKIVTKYLLFTFLTCLIGGVIGFFLGLELLPNVIYPAFDAMFFMPEMTTYRYIVPGLLTAVAMLVILCLITIFRVIFKLKGAPATLLKPKSPKAGKKILLEKITFIWKRLSFKYKSSLRNIFRYKVNLFMTIICVSGSTALAFAGFGLYAIAISPNTTQIPISMADSFALISMVIILFAAVLCIVIIFNITNMNIQERVIEIATLRVLGYQQKEVSNYIYREINITAIMSALIGMPLGYAFLNFILKFLEFGNIDDVNYYYYLITIIMVIIFIELAEILLKRKILKIDMNGSLKSNE